MFLRSSKSSSPSAWSNRRNLVSRFTALPASERRLVLTAAGVLPLAKIVLRACGLPAALGIAARMPRCRRQRWNVTAGRLGALVHAAAAQLPFRCSCLEQSIAVTWLLRRRGDACALVIDAAPTVGPFEAHAWVDTAEGPIGKTQAVAEIVRWQLPRPETR